MTLKSREISGFGFSKALKIRRSDEYQRAMSMPDARISNGPFLILLVKNDLKSGRLGLVIPKKRLRKAVDRNWLKRRVREAFRLNQSQLVGYDLVFILRANMARQDAEPSTDLLHQLFEKIQIKLANFKVTNRAFLQ